MRLIGILNWYDENPAWLAATVASMASVCDHLIAVDGAYAAYPGGTGSSGSRQHEAIRETALASGMGCTLHVPAEPWPGGEVEKRTFGFRIAESMTTDDDWLFLMDADQVVRTALGLRDELEASPYDVGYVLFCERRAIGGFPVRCLFRALRGIRLESNHFTYVRADGSPLCTVGQDGAEPGHDLSFVQVEHRTNDRDPARKRAQLDYYERRDRLGVERDLVEA